MKRPTVFALTLAAAGLATTTSYAGNCGSSSNSSYRSAGHDGADIVETALAAGSFNTLAAALDAADLVGALQGHGPFTVFAPTDEAFEKLPRGTVKALLKPENKDKLVAILTYHVVEGRLNANKVVGRPGATTLNGQRLDFAVKGETVNIDNATVISADVEASNGIIHVIDEVMLPADMNIVETAQDAGSFGTLLAAAKAAGLVDLLSHDGPFTVFAPTDDAFAKLPRGTVESLLKPENKHQLADILKYHVVPGRVYADEAVAAVRAKTAEGSKVRFGIDGGQLLVNNSTIVVTDLDTENGVIHVIDTVLMPN